jgi:hypothetical protein
MYRYILTALFSIIVLTTVSIAQMETVPEKKAGTIRIGIVSPMAEMGRDFEFADTPLAVRNTLQVALADEKVETIFLESALPDKEARLKKCDYVFSSKVMRKKGGGGFGGLGGLGMLAGAAGMISGVGLAGAIAGAAASTAVTAASMSGGFKSKDEITYEYSLRTPDGSFLIPVTTSKQKAKKNGDDVLTPQIAAAANAVLAKVADQQVAAAKPGN